MDYLGRRVASTLQIGEAAVDFIRQFKVDIGLIGISGIEEDGANRARPHGITWPPSMTIACPR